MTANAQRGVLTVLNLFYNIWDVLNASPNLFLYIFIGGRGIGKTYSALQGALDSGKKFMYLRRTDTEVKNCCNEVNNPFLTLNVDLNREVEISKLENLFVIHEGTVQHGIGASLSTFGKFRGSDFSDISYIIFDEFINTSGRNTLKNEEDLFFNLIETVQRNREITGGDSIKIILLSNSNTLDNGIIRSLNLGEIIRVLKNSDVETYTDEERGILLTLPKGVGITAEKKKTRLYKLTQGTKFYDMAIQNDFVGDDFETVKRIPNNQIIPLCQFGKACFYTVKNQDYLYVSYRKNDSPYFDESTIKNFKRQFGILMEYYIENKKIYYSDYDLTLYVENIFS